MKKKEIAELLRDAARLLRDRDCSYLGTPIGEFHFDEAYIDGLKSGLCAASILCDGKISVDDEFDLIRLVTTSDAVTCTRESYEDD